MIDAVASVEDRGVSQSLQILALTTGREVGEIIRKFTPTLARYLAARTQPVLGMRSGAPDGLSLAARDMGRAAVRRDLRRVYQSPAGVFQSLKERFPGPVGLAMARAFSRAMRNSNFAEARAIVTRAGIAAQGLEFTAWDGGALHRARRKKGRVAKSYKPVVVSNARAMKAYVEQRVARVGTAKSAWVSAAAQIVPLTGIPAWIRAAGAIGRGIDRTRDPRTPYVILENPVPYISDIMPAAQITAAGSDFERSLGISIEKRLEHMARKAERAKPVTA